MHNVVSMLYFTSPRLNLQSPPESLNFMSFEIDVPNSDTSLHQTPIFECLVVRCGSKNGYPKKQGFERDWTTCSKYNTRPRLK
jgi:hypothetical protein